MVAWPVDLPAIPVEIINHESWWQTIITPSLVGALVGGIFTLLGVYTTSRRTDKRERDNWRRDTLKQLCSDATVAALDLEHQSIDAVTNALSLPDDEVIKPSIRRIGDVVETLRLIDATELATTCQRMYDGACRFPAEAALVRSARKELEDETRGRPSVVGPTAAIRELSESITRMENILKSQISELSMMRGRFITAAQTELKR